MTSQRQLKKLDKSIALRVLDFMDERVAQEVFFNSPLLVNTDYKHSRQELRYFALGSLVTLKRENATLATTQLPPVIEHQSVAQSEVLSSQANEPQTSTSA